MKEFYEKILASKNIPSALLFSGSTSEILNKHAEFFIRDLFSLNNDRVLSKNHPDYRIYRPEGKTGMYSMQSIKEIIKEANESPYESKRKVFLILEADKMLVTGANALLKVLEEPLLTTIFVLTSEREDSIISTIKSRCLKIVIKDKPSNKIELSSNELKLFNILRNQQGIQHLQEIFTDIEDEKKKLEKQLKVELKSQYEIDREGTELELQAILAKIVEQEIKKMFKILYLWFRDRALYEEIENSEPYLSFEEEKNIIMKYQLVSLEEIEIIISNAVSNQKLIKSTQAFEDAFIRLLR